MADRSQVIVEEVNRIGVLLYALVWVGIPESIGTVCKNSIRLKLETTRGKTLAKPLERDKFKIFRKRAEVKQ